MISKKAFKALGRKKYLAAAIPLIMAAQAQGIEFYAGGVEATLDSNISLGQSWRTRDPSVVGLSDVNEDNGNIRYESGDTFSQIFKGSHDLQITYENYGAFVRGKYWYDAELENDDALDDSNNHDLAKYSGAEILDAFVYGEFDVMDMPVDVRLGKQVVNWGESTFFTGGISSINPYDVSAFRRPGSELKEGLIPVNMAFASIGLTENLSAEAFYLLEFRETVTAGCDTFFSSNDYQGEGCGTIEIDGLGEIVRNDVDVRRPDSDGQFGLAFRYFSEDLDTEFGLYAMNIHSQVPLVSGTKAAVNESEVLALVRAGVEADIGIDLDTLGALAEADPATYGAGYVEALTAMYSNTGDLAALLATNGDVAAVTGGAFTAGTAANTFLGFTPVTRNDFFTEYAEDMQIFGLSFATNVATMAISGEISHKIDVPMQINSEQIITAGLVADYYIDILGQGSDDLLLSDVYAIEDGAESSSYRVHDVTQLQITAIKLFDQVLGASRYAFIAEAGFTHINDFDESARAIKFGGGVVDSSVGYLDYEYKNNTTTDSWGYTTRVVGQYTDVFAGVNLTPVLSYSQDVKGISPNPGGNFREGNETLGFSVSALYRETYNASISYKTYTGNSTSSDRDFASMTIGMAF